jgi:valyl-tRNA synthetase
VEGSDDAVLGATLDVLAEVRKAKTAAKVSMRAPVARVEVTANASDLLALALGSDDLRDAGSIAELATREAEGGRAVEVTLA